MCLGGGPIPGYPVGQTGAQAIVSQLAPDMRTAGGNDSVTAQVLEATYAADPGGMALAFQRYVAGLDVSALSSPCCQNGSEVKPLQQEKIWIAGSAVCAALGIVWTPLAGALCELAVPFLLDVGPICSQCPPDPVAPDWTAAWASGLLPTPAVVWDWAVATFVSQTWSTWCQCAGGITGCGTTSSVGQSTGVGSTVGSRSPDAGFNNTAQGFNVTVTWTADASFTNTQFAVQVMNAANGIIATQTNNVQVGSSGSFTVTLGSLQSYLSSGATRWNVRVTNLAGTSGVAWHVNINAVASFYSCTNSIIPYTPPAVIAPPSDIPAPPALPTGCTTDQICQKITLLEQLLDALARQLQRHMLPPRGFIAFTSHASLSGNGSFTVSSITTAVRVRFVTIPNRVGLAVGNPNRRFEVGFLTPYETNGPYQTWHVDYDGQVFELPLPVAGIDYTIPVDVVLTIDELSNTY